MDKYINLNYSANEINDALALVKTKASASELDSIRQDLNDLIQQVTEIQDTLDKITGSGDSSSEDTESSNIPQDPNSEN